jgi:hypothetical protein
MVDNSSVLIAAFGGSKGGTMNTMLYAMRQGLEIIESAFKFQGVLYTPRMFYFL